MNGKMNQWKDIPLFLRIWFVINVIAGYGIPLLNIITLKISTPMLGGMIVEYLIPWTLYIGVMLASTLLFLAVWFIVRKKKKF